MHLIGLHISSNEDILFFILCFRLVNLLHTNDEIKLSQIWNIVRSIRKDLIRNNDWHSACSSEKLGTIIISDKKISDKLLTSEMLSNLHFIY